MSRVLAAGACLLLGVALLAADSEPQGEVDGLIRTIRKVGKEGSGNAEAAKAWKGLVAVGPRALTPILIAMNDDAVVANNWLRPAFEAIAEKAAEAGKLPTAELEKVLGDRKKSSEARALAYAWLVKQDTNAQERLLPGMISDPAPALRRLAVDYAVKQAEALAANEKEKATANALYKKAFAAAGDPEQIDSIAKTLTKRGEVVDVVKQLGTVQSYHLITPFDNSKKSGFDKVYPPEKGVDLTATYKGKGDKAAVWVPYKTTSPEGEVDLKKVLGPLKGTVAYAHAVIEMPEARTVELRAGSINGIKIFVNGKEVFAREEYHHGTRMDQYAVRVDLKKGSNEVLLKVCQNEQTEQWAQRWFFQLRVCDSVGCGVAFTQGGGNRENGQKKEGSR